MAYDFDIRYSRSENRHLADLLSRCGTSGKNEPDMANYLPEIRVKLNQIITQGKWKILKDYIINGFPKLMDARLFGFSNVKDSLMIHNDRIYKGTCLVIPEELRSVVLNEIHRDHLGIEKTKAHVRTLFY